jgi:esterase/lipase superfamily enzyme
MMSDCKNEKQNLLYVHGFNVNFDSAMLQAAQLGVDLKIPGATFAFSWPSAGNVNSYMADEAAIEASLPYFQEFLHRILQFTPDVPLSIIVHSMGNRAVLRVLDTIKREQKIETSGRIKNVILAAPDVDTNVFTHTMNRLATMPARSTLYATRADLALQASEFLHKYSRAGLFPPVVTVPGMDTVVVEGFNLLNLAHGYYADAASVLHDMFILLHYGSEPESRPALISTQTNDGAQYWKLQV